MQLIVSYNRRWFCATSDPGSILQTYTAAHRQVLACELRTSCVDVTVHHNPRPAWCTVAYHALVQGNSYKKKVKKSTVIIFAVGKNNECTPVP